MECYSRIVVQGLLLPNYWTYNKLRKSEDEDPKHPSYSLTEVALYPAVSGVSEAYSIGRKLDTGHYEIFNYQHQNAYSDGSVIFVNEEIEYMIDYANILGDTRSDHPALNTATENRTTVAINIKADISTGFITSISIRLTVWRYSQQSTKSRILKRCSRVVMECI